MDVEIHPHALKHLTAEEVMSAWWSIQKCIQRQSDDEPPRWLAMGFLPSGKTVELVMVETLTGWLIFHAKSPAEPKFMREIERTERGEI